MTVLDSMFVPRGSNANRVKQLVILDSTFTFRRENIVPGVFNDLYHLPGADSTAINDFAQRNLESHSLRYLSTLRLGIPIGLVSRETLSSLPHGDPEKYWGEFYRRYPGSGGSISFSAIGYGPDGNLALLMVATGCGSLCGAGYNVVVKKDAGRWRVRAIQMTVVS